MKSKIFTGRYFAENARQWKRTPPPTKPPLNRSTSNHGYLHYRKGWRWWRLVSLNSWTLRARLLMPARNKTVEWAQISKVNINMQIRRDIYIYSILNKCKFTYGAYSCTVSSSSSSSFSSLPSLSPSLPPPGNSSHAFCYLYNLYINHLHDLCAYTCCHRRRINKLNKRKCSYVCNYAIHSLPQRYTTPTL